MKKVLMAVLLLFAIIPSAQAQLICVKRADLVAHLKNSFQEEINSRGVSENGTLLEIFVSPSGSWTMAATTADGISCLVASGNSFETVKPKPKENPA